MLPPPNGMKFGTYGEWSVVCSDSLVYECGVEKVWQFDAGSKRCQTMLKLPMDTVLVTGSKPIIGYKEYTVTPTLDKMINCWKSLDKSLST